MSAVVHVLKTAKATFWTGPQVFQTVHYMACREKIRRMYHRRPYTATSTSLPILATCNSYSLGLV